MLKIVRVGIDGAEKVFVYHSKYETFRYTTHDSLIDRESLGPREDRESFEFYSRHVIPQETRLQCLFVGKVDSGVWPNAFNKHFGTEKFENGL
jgi:hypothetical protein